jgi:succinate dehydrogenase/fumarate reductase flavoprotein subunit
MLYLAMQMAFLLLVSALIGITIGWWAKRVSQVPAIDAGEESVVEPDNTEMDDDIYALKNRLDKCFDENASLHRDVKAKETQLRRLNARSEPVEGISSDASSEALRDKVIALMDDLQLRDDTILALEKEIGAMKN